MKLFSVSIEIEKCGNTENKNKEATLPFNLEQSLNHSNQLYFWISWISCYISTTSTLSSLSSTTTLFLGSLPFCQSEVNPSSMYWKHFTYTLISALIIGNRLFPPLEYWLLETKKTVLSLSLYVSPSHPSHESQIQYVLNKCLLHSKWKKKFLAYLIFPFFIQQKNPSSLQIPT